MATTEYKVDVLPVGNGGKGDDAIAMRWGTPGNYKVLVYDGGTRESGEALVAHVRMYYQTSRVDYLINSHPDGDHASGLAAVLEDLDVGELWMHRPWEHSAVIRAHFKHGRTTDEALAQRLKARMEPAYRLEEMAMEKGIPVREPFQGDAIGPFWVLSPPQEWYVDELIPALEKSPGQKSAQTTTKGTGGLLADAVRTAAEWLSERWRIELLREDVETSAENASSVNLFADFHGRGVLLTGEAGIQALFGAAVCAEHNGIDLPCRLRFVQAPHHGSGHNVSTSVLGRVVGTRRASDGGN